MRGNRRSLFLFFRLGIVVGTAAGCGKPAQQPPLEPAQSPPLVASPRQVVLDGDEVHVLFELDGNIPVVKFTAPDGTQRRLMLDTGANALVMSPELATACHLTTRPASSTYEDASGSGTLAGIARIIAFKIGAARFEDFDASLIDLRNGYDALLGWPMFADELLTIDYPRRQLVLTHGSLPEPDGKRILRIRNEHGCLMVPTTLEGRETWLALDTGCGGAPIGFTTVGATNVSWVSPLVVIRNYAASALIWEKVGRLRGDLMLGQYRFVQPIASTTDQLQVGVLGAAILANFTVTLDLHDLRVRFDRAANDSPEFRFDFMWDNGFLCDWRSQPPKVSDLLPGGEAEHAGLRAGDVLVRIDGHSAAEGLAHHSGPNPLSIEVQRGDKKLTLAIPLTTVVH